MPGRSELETRLSAVRGFEDPELTLEQYPTPPSLAATLVHEADIRGDLRDRTVVDLGTGTGMLALAARCRAPNRVVGVDVDPDALAVARSNRRRVGVGPVDWVRADATAPPLRVAEPVTVVMNPPFGARDGSETGDRPFLAAAADLAAVSYSVHNGGSRGFVESFVADRGGEVTHAYASTVTLDRRFDFHAVDGRALDVEVYRVEWPTGSAPASRR